MHLLYPLIVSAGLFSIGVYGLLARRNLVLVLMSVELMFGAVSLNLVAFDVWLTDALRSGQVLTLMVIAIAVAEVGLGLAIEYLLVDLAVLSGRSDRALGGAGATLAYLAVYVLMTVGAFACIAAIGTTARGAGAGVNPADGPSIESVRGLARDHPRIATALALFLIGLAGLPPASLGLFGKVVVVRAALPGVLAGSESWWRCIPSSRSCTTCASPPCCSPSRPPSRRQR